MVGWSLTVIYLQILIYDVQIVNNQMNRWNRQIIILLVFCVINTGTKSVYFTSHENGVGIKHGS